MKKKLLLALVSCIAALSITGCANDTTKTTEAVTETQTTVAADTTKEETTEITEQTENKVPSEVTIKETVLLDSEGIKITATGINTGGFMGDEITLKIENSSETNVIVQAKNVVVNGYMVDSSISTDVVAGKTNNDSLLIMNSSLETCGIDSIATIELSFHIFTSENWETYLDSDTIVINTSIAEGYVQNYDDSGEVIFEANDIKIISKGAADESLFGPGLLLYIENNSSEDITIQARNTSVDGFMVEPVFSTEVVSGKKAISSILFMKSDLETNGIETIGTIETAFTFFNTDSWSTILDTDAITISLN